MSNPCIFPDEMMSLNPENNDVSSSFCVKFSLSGRKKIAMNVANALITANAKKAAVIPKLSFSNPPNTGPAPTPPNTAT